MTTHNWCSGFIINNKPKKDFEHRVREPKRNMAALRMIEEKKIQRELEKELEHEWL